MGRIVRIAAAAYQPTWLDTFAIYRAKIEAWIRRAADEGADLVVFPEYGLMELASLDGAAVASDLARSMAAVAARDDAVHEIFRGLAGEQKLHVLAPSGPVRRADGTYINRAVLHAPNGCSGMQEKLVMTRFERETWAVSRGGGVNVFDTALGRIGVLICYDAEFPLAARAMVEAGAEILLVPTCTDTVHGYTRVQVGAQARALEGQMITVAAPLVGEAAWSPAIDVNRGRAGIFGPPDIGFPDSGIIALGDLDAPGFVNASVDLDLVTQVRRSGQVLNFAHWPEQPGATELAAAVVDLR